MRGTIGGHSGENLTPVDIVEFAAAFAFWLKKNGENPKIVIGRDGRISGPQVNGIVVNTLQMMGIDVIDLGLSTTPTVEIAVPRENAGAGIIITASHNPKQWNALKFLNSKGEFISANDGTEILNIIQSKAFAFSEVDDLGTYKKDDSYIDKHIQLILNHDLVNPKLIASKKFKVVVDCINSTGAISIPPLLDALGCEYVLINADVNGQFAHNPEPLPKHLTQISDKIKQSGADLGIVIDPDVDRLAFICEDGEMFGEEYTLVAIADYILGKKGGNTVSNLSSTRALRDVTEKHGGTYLATAVGEVNVVNGMKASNAVIGGEGNGGIIVPELHYGRDALIGIALFLSHLAEKDTKMSDLKASYPQYVITKNKIQLTPALDVDLILKQLKEKYKNENINTVDGLKIDFEHGWVHLRKSNTEPIIRIYAESHSQKAADDLAEMVQQDVLEIC